MNLEMQFLKWSALAYETTGLKEGNMDKYAVETDDEKTKTASTEKNCPTCGKPLDQDSGVPRCEGCGTKPFEKERG